MNNTYADLQKITHCAYFTIHNFWLKIMKSNKNLHKKNRILPLKNWKDESQRKCILCEVFVCIFVDLVMKVDWQHNYYLVQCVSKTICPFYNSLQDLQRLRAFIGDEAHKNTLIIYLLEPITVLVKFANPSLRTRLVPVKRWPFLSLFDSVWYLRLQCLTDFCLNS